MESEMHSARLAMTWQGPQSPVEGKQEGDNLTSCVIFQKQNEKGSLPQPETGAVGLPKEGWKRQKTQNTYHRESIIQTLLFIFNGRFMFLFELSALFRGWA